MGMDLSKIQNQYKSNAEKEQNNSGDFKQRYERLMCWGKYEDAYDLCIKSVNSFNAAEVKQCAERALGMMCKATRQFKPIIAPETVSYDYITDTLIANGVNKMRMRDDLTLGGVSVSIKESAETKQVYVKVSRFRKILFALMLIPLSLPVLGIISFFTYLEDTLWFPTLLTSPILILYPVFIWKSYRKAMRIKQIVGNAIFDSVVERRIKNNSDNMMLTGL